MAAAGSSASDAGAASMWIGVAIDVPEPWGGILTRRRERTLRRGEYCPPAHVTLLPPTEIVADRLAEVEAHLASVALAHPPYALHLRGTGTFRPVTQVVFVAVAAGIGECEQLADAIGRAGAVPVERRFPYHPHVTVAQDVPSATMDEVYEELSDFSARFDVNSFTLFSRSGEVAWQPIRTFRLTGGPLPPAPVD